MDKRLVMILNGVIGDTYGCSIEMMPMEIIHYRYGTLIDKYIVTDKIKDRQYTYTDDSEMTLAVLEIIYEYLYRGEITKESILDTYIKYFEPTRGYSSDIVKMFLEYTSSGKIKPRDTITNGAIMRISPVSFITEFNEDQKIKDLIKIIHFPTHVNEESYHVSFIFVKILTHFNISELRFNKRN